MLHKFSRMVVTPGTRYKAEVIGFILIYLLVCLFIILLSPTAVLYVGHDMAPVLDGVWRIENHQVPHKDFSSILGYGYLLQQYLFLKVFHYDFIAFPISSIAITTVAFLIFLSFYYSPDFKENTSRLLRCYLFVLLVSLGLGQYHFGEKHTLLTYANLYNRYSFLCLLILFIQFILLRDIKTVNAKLIARLFIAALLLNYLLFVKLTYFIVAIALLTVCLFASVVSFQIYSRLLLICAIIFMAASWAFKANFVAMLQDYQIISSVRGKVLLQPAFILSKLFQYYNLAFLISLFLLIAEMLLKKLPFKFILLTGFTGLCAVFLQFTNWGTTDIVMLSFVPALFILLPQYKKLLSFKIFWVVCCFFILKNLRSIYHLSRIEPTRYTELKSGHLSRFYTDFTEIACRQSYAAWVMSGVELVDRNKKNSDRVFSFSFDNPFPFLTQTVPPKGVPTVWQYATTYTYDVYTAPEKLFSQVDLLMVPKCLQAESATEMMKLYGAAITEHYAAIDNNTHWTLYRKIKPF